MEDPVWQKATSSEQTGTLKRLEIPHGLVHIRQNGELKPARYLFFKPPGFEISGYFDVKWPVLFFLHGHHERGKADKVAMFFTGHNTEFDDFALNNFLIIAPLAEWGSALLHEDGHQFDIKSLTALCTRALADMEPRVDLGRVCATGYSMGADAAASLACQWGSNLAAVALFAGSYKWFEDTAKSADVTYDDLRHVEVRCFHNETDAYISVDSTIQFLDFMRKELVYDQPSVRKIVIPYPSNVISFVEQIKASKEATSHLAIHITEYDGGSKASWILRDAVHLADGHICWPIVYGNEASFGLFHWMLSCNSRTRRPRVQLQTRNQLSLDSVQRLLAALKAAYSNDILRQSMVKLVACVGRDKFTFLMHAQRLIFEAQKHILKEFKFKMHPTLTMNAALSEHLLCTLPEESRLSVQDQWDQVRKALYGSMYNACWPPSEERGAEAVQPFPQEVVDKFRGSRQPFTSEQGLQIHAEMCAALTEETQKSSHDAISSAIPILSIEEIFEMQADLRDAFCKPEFQAGLRHLKQEALTKSAGRIMFLKDKLLLQTQTPILVKYGFEASRKGQLGMLLRMASGCRMYLHGSLSVCLLHCFLD